MTPGLAVALDRRRSTTDGWLEEVFEVTNAGGAHVRFRLTASARMDLATM